MKTLVESIMESLLLERNEKIWPTDNKRQKFSIWAGQHYQERKKERNVNDKEVIDAFWAAYNELNAKFKDGEIKATRTGEESRFIIVDARKDRANPLNISAFIYFAPKQTSLSGASFTVRTVYKGEDFSGTLRGTHSSKGNEVKIFLY